MMAMLEPSHQNRQTRPSRRIRDSARPGHNIALVATALLGMMGSSVAAQAPLPPTRPPELQQQADDVAEAETPAVAPTQPPTPEPPEPQRASASGLPGACAALAEAGIITARRVASPRVPRPCALSEAVSLTAVQLDDGSSISFKPAALMSCEMVVAIADWTREDLAPDIEKLGARLETLRVASSFSCRGQNRKSGARVSEHGYGNAMDVGGFVLSDGRSISVSPRGMPNAFALAMKESACRRFTTVLGPGSDGYHEDHIHVDLAKRRNGFKLCRWRLPGSTTPERRYVRASATEIGTPTAEPARNGNQIEKSAPLPPVRPEIPAREAED